MCMYWFVSTYVLIGLKCSSNKHYAARFAQGNRYLTYKVSKALRLIFPRPAAADKGQLISKVFFFGVFKSTQ